MSEESSRIMELLRQELQLLSLEHKVYEQLFLRGEERTRMLMETASALFQLIHFSLLDSMILRLCKLTDPAETSGHKNLSFSTFLSSIGESLPEEVRDGCYEHLHKINTISDQLRVQRNKRIAHKDLHFCLEPKEIGQGSSSYDKVASASTFSYELMNMIEALLPNGPVLYDQIIALGSDGDALMSTIQIARYYVAEESAGRISKVSRILAQNEDRGERRRK